MGDIGTERREVEFDPLRVEPAREPVPASPPAQPETEPAYAPSSP